MKNTECKDDRQQRQQQIAELAARLMVEDGHEGAQARRKAAALLGGNARGNVALPDNECLASAVRAYLRSHLGAEHDLNLRRLRTLALEWMQVLAPFEPRLVGAVLNGSATPQAHVHLHLFTDSAKDVEMALLDRGLDIRVAPPDGNQGHAQEVIGFVTRAGDADASSAATRGRAGGRAAPRGTAPCEATPVMITVFDRQGQRVAAPAAVRQRDPDRHPVECAGRADAAMVRQLLAATASVAMAVGAAASGVAVDA